MREKIKTYRQLDIWKTGIELVKDVYRITDSFPQKEIYGLTSQMRRAAVSICSNVAEGSGRSSDNDFARFVEIAYGSLMEVVSQGRIAARQIFLDTESHDELYKNAEELARMLSGSQITDAALRHATTMLRQATG